MKKSLAHMIALLVCGAPFSLAHGLIDAGTPSSATYAPVDQKSHAAKTSKTSGTVAVIYHVNGVNAELKFSPTVLADIFLGRISSWSDGRIEKDNPGVRLPNENINVVHRADANGTTAVFTNYLSTASRDWAGGPGRGTTVSWPKGIGAKGDRAVADMVRQLNGSIGYVEASTVLLAQVPQALVKSAAGTGSWVNTLH